MKQKLVRTVLIIGSVWALTACQKNGGQESTGEETVAEAGAQGDDDTQDEDSGQENDVPADTQETEETGETDTGGSEMPFVRTHTIYYDEGDSYEYATGSFERAEIVGDAFPKLTESVGALFDSLEENFNTTMQQYVEYCKEEREEMGEDLTSIAYYFNKSVDVCRLDGNVASFMLAEESYSGGAHGSNYMYGVTFDSVTGEEITFADLGDIEDDVMEAIDHMVAEERKEREYACLAYEDVRDELLEELEWYLDGTGLQIVLNTYSIASYAEGDFFVTLPYDEMPGFSDAYKPHGDVNSYMLNSYAENKGDFDGDGEEDVLEIKTKTDEYGNLEYSLGYNGQVTDLDYCAAFGRAYYLHGADGRNYVLVSFDEASDDYVTVLYEIKDKKLSELSLIGGDLEILVGNRAGLEVSMYTLGTYAAYRSYRVWDGAFVPVEERFEFYNAESDEPRRGIVLKTPLKVMLERDGQMTEEELPAKTVIYPVNSDDESVLGFRLDGGAYGELSFIREDGIIYMDGVSEFDVFEDLPYAG